MKLKLFSKTFKQLQIHFQCMYTQGSIHWLSLRIEREVKTCNCAMTHKTDKVNQTKPHVRHRLSRLKLDSSPDPSDTCSKIRSQAN